MSDHSLSNSLLASLSAGDFALLQPHLEPIALELRFTLEGRNQPITHVYFPQAGLASVVANGAHKREIEVGIIGKEGMSGITVVLGGDRSPNVTFMQVAGHGHRIAVNHLRAAMQESMSLHQCFLRFVQTFMMQTAHTALANGQGKVEERLARWLLMADDRIDGDELPLTHEFLALMLAVRRPGVTVALQELERHNLITAERGIIAIQDREGLEQIANGFYGVPEAEYRRLIGPGAQTP